MSTSLDNSNKQIKVMNGFSTFSQVVDDKELWGVLNEKGEEVVPCKYEVIEVFRDNGLAKVKRDGLWGLVNEKGEEVVPCMYEEVRDFSEGFAPVEKNGLWGFVNDLGEQVIPCRYDYVYHFCKGFTCVEKDGLWGTIDKQGNEVIPCKYEDVRLFRKASMSRFDIWLVDLLTREKKLSFEKIAERWKKDSLNNTNVKKELALRTFHNHRKTIKEKLGVEVCCDKSTNTYYIKKVSQVSIEKSKFIAQLVSNSSVLNYAENLQDRVLLEQHAKNTFLKDIIAAMEQGVKIKLKYQKYTTRQSVSERKVAPYCVKLFRNRWYMLAAVNHLKPKLYALDDRTKEVMLTAETFEMPKDFNAQAYFKDAFGVYAGDTVEHIEIKTFGNETLYWRSAPLHPSQKEIKTADDYSIFELKLFPAWEFKQELFSRIDQIEVLEPKSLREEVIGFIDRMRNIYNPKE